MKCTISINEDRPVFLIQRKLDNGEVVASLMESADLCEYICMDDCHDEQYEIWDVTTYGEAYKCHYKGWQPGCLIEVVRDFDEKLVLSMYGVDH